MKLVHLVERKIELNLAPTSGLLTRSLYLVSMGKPAGPLTHSNTIAADEQPHPAWPAMAKCLQNTFELPNTLLQVGGSYRKH